MEILRKNYLGEETSPVNGFTVIFNCGLMSTFILVLRLWQFCKNCMKVITGMIAMVPYTRANLYVTNLWSSVTATEEWPEDDYFALLSVS